MNHSYDASTSLTINASPEKIWQGFVDPEKFKQWMFGSIVSSDWKKGSPITYHGEWNGTPYEDKGVILDIIPGALLKTTYYSSMSGKKDIPENYQEVTYKIDPTDTGGTLTLTMGNNATQEAADKAVADWGYMLGNLKTLIEKDR